MRNGIGLVLVMLMMAVVPAKAADGNSYKESKEYLTLRDSMHHAFNDADSARFFVAVRKLEGYLLKQNDLHAYYTQRCNEIVFHLNRQNVFEAYKLATELSKELAERKLDKEMYMAINMMGHIYSYSGNKESAKKCFWEVIRLMEREGYTESLPPIYMNLVNIIIDENPDEALRLIDQAVSIAHVTSPEREFDIEARRTLAYYRRGDMERFLKGYQAYKEGVTKGLSSVHGRSLEVYYQAYLGNVDEAAKLAADSEDDPYETMADVYSKAGRWKEAYDALKLGRAESDSINSIILSSSMQGIQQELRFYEARRQSAHRMVYALLAIAGLLSLLVMALVYIVQSRRRHWRQLDKAYQRVLESDKMKTAFIQNVSHEVRTPLNVISGFAQVISAPGYSVTAEERQHMADAIQHNTHRITTMIDEVLEMSHNEVTMSDEELTSMKCNDVLRQIALDFRKSMESKQPELRFDTALDDDCTIRTNEGILRRILNPLFDNAVKNTPIGTVTLRAAATDTQLMLMVEDTGCGVPAGEAEHIFERFVKLDSFKEGLGLGLTFSRTMAQRLGGDVKLDTTYDKGARFIVTIPLVAKQ